MEAVQVALIGAGEIAQSAHLPAWRACDRASVGWIADADGLRAERVAREWQIPRWTADASSLIDDPAVNAVDVCTPASTHAALAVPLLDAGKHVLVEKPAALNLKDLKAMIDAAASTGCVGMVAENWVFSAAFQTAQHAIATQDMGRLLALVSSHESPFWVDAMSPSGPDSDHLGYFIAAGSHNVHAARLLAGDIESIAAFATFADRSRTPPCDYELVLSGQTASGALASMTFLGRSRHLGERRLWFKLLFEHGVIELDVWAGWVEVTHQSHRKRLQQAHPSRGFEEEVEHFVDCMLHHAEPLTSLAAYAPTLATLLAGYQSASEGRVIAPHELIEAG
jgi:predicted dehydrogenase